MYLKDLLPSVLIRQANLQMNLKSTRSNDGFIEQLFAICHADHEYVVSRVDAVQLRQQLVDYGRARFTSCAATGASLLTDSVDLIEDNDVQI